MIIHIAASCSTGSWAQRWQCNWNAGWHQPVNATVTRAGFDTGHNALPVLVLIAFLLLVVMAARRRKGTARKVEPAAKAWKRAEAPVRR